MIQPIMVTIGAWVGLVSLILRTCDQLDERVDEVKKQRIASTLRGSIWPDPMNWYRSINTTFIDIFNRVYGYQDSTVERLTWFGIILTYWIFMTLRASAWLFDIQIPRTSMLLGIAIGISAATVLGVAGIFGSVRIRSHLLRANRYIPDVNDKRINFYVRGIAGSILLSLLSMGLLFSLVDPSIPFTFMAGLTVPVLTIEFILFTNQQRDAYPIDPAQHSHIAKLCVGLLGATVLVYNLLVFGLSQSTAVTWSFIYALGLITLLVPLGVYISFNIPPRWFNANPLRAMMLSMVTVVIVGGLNFSASQSFFATIEAQGVIMLTFLAFNMFADTISLQETNWILQESRRASPAWLVPLLIADLILSAIIYLLLPIFVGQGLLEFWRGIQFTGPSPWIGILFWSTFSTSAIFYIFVGAVILMRFARSLGVTENPLDTWFKLDDNPIWVIGLIASVLVTIVFAIVFAWNFLLH